MISEKYYSKTKCNKCGRECYRVCYIGTKVVCLQCFIAACNKRMK